MKNLLAGRLVAEIVKVRGDSTSEVIDALAKASFDQVDDWVRGKGSTGETYKESYDKC